MSYTLGILGNTKAGGGVSKPREKIVRFALLHDIPFRETSCLKDVVPAIQYLVVEKEVDLLCIYGGDGTTQKALNVLFAFLKMGLIKKIPRLFFLGGGTMRSNLYVCGWFWKSPIAVLRWAHKAIQNGEEIEFIERRPLVLRFGDDKHYGFQILGGILGRLGQYMNGGTKRWWIFVWKMLCAIYSAITGRGKAAPFLEPEKLEISFDGVAQSEANYLGYFFESFSRPLPTMLPWGNIAHGEDEILVMASALKPRQVAWRLIGLWRRWLKNPRQTINTVVKKITIRSPRGNLFLLLEGDDFDIGAQEATIYVSLHTLYLAVRTKKRKPLT